jgi:phenylpropionate dioxygenase-like ring-hydroxylating dioxygenase large terminal subunit
MSSKLSNDRLSVFNKRDRVVEGWYWALQSANLRKGRAEGVNLNGKQIVLFRTTSGEVIALDAYCRHRGANLALGTVEGDGIRCHYHRWKYDSQGELTDVPCLDAPPAASIDRFPTEEKYGLIWVWTGKEAKHPVPFVPPELEGYEIVASLAPTYKKGCHPNVVMCDAIDAQHFRSVHHVEGNVLDLKTTIMSDTYVRTDNVAKLKPDGVMTRLASLLYKESITFSLSYWYGHTGTVTVGPDFLHGHVMFTNRIGPDGSTEGVTVALTRKRKGPMGRIVNQAVLKATQAFGAYFALGDTPNYDSIRMDFQTPIKDDHNLIAFIQHVESLPLATWGYGDPSTPPGLTPAAADALV